jgi:glycosyltransferase involved in cell wall biosynthesis
MRVAIVHDWLQVFAGAERVLARLFTIYPNADLFSLVDFLPNSDRAQLENKFARTSPIQHFPFAQKHFRKYLPLLPWAASRLDVRQYDLVISSSHAFAKGARFEPGQTHVCYCYTPMRYAWAMTDNYLNSALESSALRFAAPMIVPLAKQSAAWLRRWDLKTVAGVTEFAACSQYIQSRIKTHYQRDSTVIYPPVEINRFDYRQTREEFYITVSRLVPYKRIDLLVHACTALHKKLLIVGSGPELTALKAIAGPTIEFLGWQSDHAIAALLARAKAFLFAADEDFGIVPVEAQAAGCPVIAFGVGGALETVISSNGLVKPSVELAKSLENRVDSAEIGLTGVLFQRQNEQSVIDALQHFEEYIHLYTSVNCRVNAERFSPNVFDQSLARLVAGVLIKDHP